MKIKGNEGRIIVPVQDFKYGDTKGIFTCYGNVKNFIDHARDRTVDGCFMKSILKHKTNGTMPRQLWMHDPRSLPVGPWIDMVEDENGLWMEGKLSDTTQGRDIRTLAQDKALDSFSIGYRTISEKWNSTLGCNDLLELDIMEVSWVNFACNELSTLESIKSRVNETGVISKADLREVLQSSGLQLSKRDIERITSYYNPDQKSEILLTSELSKTLEDFDLFN